MWRRGKSPPQRLDWKDSGVQVEILIEPKRRGKDWFSPYRANHLSKGQ